MFDDTGVAEVLRDHCAKPAPKVSEPERRTDRAEAERLAAMIRGYWSKMGYSVDVQVVTQSLDGRPVYVIASDLVGGLPKDWTQPAVCPPFPESIISRKTG